MSLVRFSFTKNPIVNLHNKIRQIYDIDKLLGETEINDFINSYRFESMLLTGANDNILSFKNKSNWLVNHREKILIFSTINNGWSQIRNIYLTTFSELIYVELPTEEVILNTLSKVSDRS